MAVKTRVTTNGVIQSKVEEESLATFSVEIPSFVPSMNTVVWAPFASPGEAAAKGWTTSWADAVATVQKLQTLETFIQIEADPWNDTVIIPGGEWTLNNTTIVGKVTYADEARYYYGGTIGSEGHRGYQKLLEVYTEGYDDQFAADTNPCRLNSVKGLKDMFWRGDQCYNVGRSGGASIAFDVNTGIVTLSNYGNNFYPTDVGNVIEIYNSGDSDNNGRFPILSVINSSTVTYLNANGVDGDSCDWSLYNTSGEVIAFDPDTSLTTFRRTGGHPFVSIDGPDARWVESGENEGRFPSQIIVYDNNYPTGGGNGGVFDVVQWIDENTVTYYNGSGYVESNQNCDMIRNNSTFFYNEEAGSGGEFILDNVDFRNGGTQFGSLYVGDDGYQFVKLKNGASIRWYAIRIDGLGVIQSDGSPCWIGNYAIDGYGLANIYVQPGMEFRDNQDVSYNVYNPIIWYNADNYSDWNGYPQSVHAALNELASRVRALEP